MGLKIGRGGRVAAATVLATLLLSLAFASAFKLGSRAQPARAPCSCAACASASPGGAPKAVNVEWLNGSERASAVERALSLEEFGKVARALEKLGYKPAPEKALAVRFEREVKGGLAKHLLVAVPFEGDSEKPAGVLVALEPLEGAAAFQLDRKSGILKLVAEEPKGFLAHLMLRADPSAQPAETGCSSPKPQCPTCYFASCQCVNFDYACAVECCAGICGTICGPPTNWGCWLICMSFCFMINTYCYARCCKAFEWQCISCGGCGSPACYDYQDCWDCPDCWNC
jgi:hypothetical protein